MAQLAPSDLSSTLLRQAHAGELATLAHLKAALPDDYIVFHGVHWSQDGRSRPVYGEADFVILNRSGDVVVIEQKNGALQETPSGLAKDYGAERKDVGRQIHRTLDAIRDKFGLHNRQGGLTLDYLLYCPDHRLRSLNAVGLDASRIVDASGAGELAARIQALIGPGRDSAEGERVRRFFENACELVPDIHAHVAAGERSMIRLAGGLASSVGSIEMRPLRLRVKGTAGCGKSAVAARAYAEALQHGRRPLMVCFNRPLAEKLKAAVGPGGRVDTWYGFLSRFLEASGKPLDFTQMRERPDFWREAIDSATAEPVPEAWQFDTVIVDEGQDFEPDWAEVLELFAAPGADRLWLEDPDQALTRRGGSAVLADFVGYRARANHRSPESIGRFLQRALPFSFEIASTLPGLGAGVHAVRQPEDQSAKVAQIVTDLLRQGFKHADIAVLSLSSLERASLRQAQRIGSYTVRRFTGDYDLLGNQVTSGGQLLFDTVRRFKGQQAPAIILTDIDPDPARLEEAQRLLFCGGTRATVRLDLVVRRDNLANARLLDAA